MLKMKRKCEKCKTRLELQDAAFICSFECTFCGSCSDEMSSVCPNCSGELLRRPKRIKTPVDAAISQVKKKLFSK